ncbi:diacylglycerol kinase [Rhodosalinus halophilus]|uniref:Diacylglycerol kinase n=1 Tax=Rhodosalinus halophilus TaxID=2259333 RepID=A0A365UDW0_9RHOB|nr:diacylglycerol kinase family protein [Rhodosalinus halophilus]RBI87640.1 diacylglycerol kinase [Rhodosalinus halophilus]
MAGQVALIVNPAAGDDTAGESRADWLARLFRRVGLRPEIRRVGAKQTPGDVAREALAAGVGSIVAAGGDGTVSSVADAVCAHRPGVPLGVVPLGTFNYFARGLGLPQTPEAAVEAIAAGATREVRPGIVNGRVFLNNMSLGLYPSILERREGVYARWGRSRPAAYWSVLLALAGMQRPMRLSLTLDGRTRRLRTPLLFVARSAFQLDTYNLEGARAVREGGLAVFAARGRRRRDLVRAAWGLARGKARRGEDFALGTGRRIEIDTGRARGLVARDGEREWMHMPLRVTTAERPLRVIVPAEGR